MSVSETTLLGRNNVKPGKHCVWVMHYPNMSHSVKAGGRVEMPPAMSALRAGL